MVAVLVLLLQVGAAPPMSPRGSSLSAAARATARPRECAVWSDHSAAAGRANVWEAARDPVLDAYCDLLARGYAELPFSPDEARLRADAAERVAPGRAGPPVLRARAYASQKAWGQAAAEFEKARAIDPRSFDDPASMREWARALARVGRGSEALAVYRTLGPRLSGLATAEERARTFVEAAELAFSLGPSGLDDAIAFLAEAKELAIRELDWKVSAELALALDRKGSAEESGGLVAELARRRRKGAKPAAAESSEEQAANALVLEAVDARRAVETWQAYLTAVGEGGPFAEHARQRLVGLRKKGGEPSRGGGR